MPAFPITPTFPLLGPLGMLPLPVKYRIHFGDPLRFRAARATTTPPRSRAWPK